MVTVHGRTRQQFYTGSADWDFIARGQAGGRLPVIANGDILTEDDAAEALRRSGADGVMIGRGCYGRPWLPAQVAHYLRTGERLPEPALLAQKSLLLEHYAAMLSHFGTDPGLRLARKHLAWYSRGLPGSADFRATVNRLTETAPVFALIDQFYDRLIAAGAARLLPARTEAADRGGRMSGAVTSRLRAVIGRVRDRTPAAPEPLALLGALPVPVVVLDVENRFRYANHAAEQFLGISTAHLAQLRLRDLVPTDNPLFLLIEQVRDARGHRLRPRPDPGQPAAAQARHHRAGLAAAGGARRGGAGAAGRFGRARARPATGVPRRGAQRDRHGGDPGP